MPYFAQVSENNTYQQLLAFTHKKASIIKNAMNMKNAKIAGIGYYVPDNIVTNDDLAQRMTTSDEWIQERTGIQERRYADVDVDKNYIMAAKASRKAMEQAGITAQDVDFIIFATLSPDYYFPGSGVLLQRELGCGTIGALDIRNQCSGFVYGLSIAEQYHPQPIVPEVQGERLLQSSS